MTIRYLRGNLLDSDCDGLVNAVNCEGVMGCGVARQFRERFPDMFRDYEWYCEKPGLLPGGVHVYRYPDGPVIINVATKDSWRLGSNPKWVKKGLAAMVRVVRELSLESVALPALGCGNGGLTWEEVHPLILEAYERFSGSRFDVYLPGGK